jgi:hypothetical protein
MSIYGFAANCVAFVQHFASAIGMGELGYLLGYQIRPNDYFQTADSRGFEGELGDLGYWVYSHSQK